MTEHLISLRGQIAAEDAYDAIATEHYEQINRRALEEAIKAYLANDPVIAARFETADRLERLAANGIEPDRLTFMRQAGDRRPDDVVKRQMLHRAAKLGKWPDAIFDDRDRVVAMWRAEGIPCFQVALGAF